MPLLNSGTSQKILKRSHATNGEAGSESVVVEVMQPDLASDIKRALPENLMEEICSRDNLNAAFRKVKANKGAAGIDRMTIDALSDWIKQNKEKFVSSLLSGEYQPQPVRAVEIPKPNGGVRQLGIPTVVDRLVQQAILQILQPIFEKTFSDSSYGFRPGRSAHDALKRASQYVEAGKHFVIDVDLEKFFDRVNHDMLMARVAKYVRDKRLLRLIRSFLKAGIMSNGVLVNREEGTPQGGNLSPLLSNILLTDLDKELEKRGHKFVRYADDCNIYVNSEAAAKRVLENVTNWLESNLKLKVNREKSAAAKVSERKFLGYQILIDGRLSVAWQSVKRFKTKVINLTKRRVCKSMNQIIDGLNPLIQGWLQYFRMSIGASRFRDLDGWIRRRLRCLRLHQCKRSYATARYLIKLGVTHNSAWMIAKSGKGKWRLSRTPQVQQAMNNNWFNKQGLLSLESLYLTVNNLKEPPYTQVRTVV